MITFILILLIPFVLGSWVNEMENRGRGFYQGDMRLNPAQLESVKNGKPGYAAVIYKRWGRTIPYSMSTNLRRNTKARKAIMAAIADYHRYTCIRFVPKTSRNRDYMYFMEGYGCSSYVGKDYGKNEISLDEGCWARGTVIHEIGHSLGLHHEQSRPDRNDYLIIHHKNIEQEMKHNFDLEHDVDVKAGEYDYRSIMQYDKTAFGVRGKVTMEAKDKYYKDLIGTGKTFSHEDIIQINKLYRCSPYEGELPSQPTPECHDNDPYCEMDADDGKCTSRYHGKRTRALCPFSCGVCKIDPEAVYPPAPGQPKYECVDIGKTYCEGYRQHCRERKWLPFMNKYCAKTCRFC